MATFVLVPGAWLGGWCWSDVADELRRAGHWVHCATLTGLADRRHLVHPQVGLSTHVADIVNLLTYETARDVVLVGHSYAGAVVTGVADVVPERLRRLVFVDTAPVPDGAAVLDFYPPAAESQVRRAVTELGDGWLWPFPGFDELGETASLDGLGPATRAEMARLATSQPFRTVTEKLRLDHPPTNGVDCLGILCHDGRAFVEQGAELPGRWEFEHLDTGHWPMLSRPAELAAILDAAA